MAKQVLQQVSPWSDKLNDLVISEQITLTQEPQRQPYRCPFDDEGDADTTVNVNRARTIKAILYRLLNS